MRRKIPIFLDYHIDLKDLRKFIGHVLRYFPYRVYCGRVNHYMRIRGEDLTPSSSAIAFNEIARK